MSDEKVERDAHRDAGVSKTPVPVNTEPSGGNTADRAPNVDGGQPAVGEDLPLNTEF